MSSWFAPVALVGPSFAAEHDVRIEVEGGRVTAVSPDTDPAGAVRLPDVVLPGVANCHGHLFHRALRGRTSGPAESGGAGSFWTWRTQMYALAEVLDPDLMHRLALGVYAEMAAAGITTVGEFHYLHHGPGGARYADENAMGVAVIEAARAVGIRIALLDACYLAAGFGLPPEGVQERFGDGDADAWAQRVGALADAYAGDDGVVVGAAVHSVRAVPRDQIGVVAAWAAEQEAPLHVHVSEQPAENDECRAATGMTPVQLLEDCGALGTRTTAVHATHLTEEDVGLLGSSRTYACFCPTTERELADGVGPSAALRAAGSPLTLGSDSNAVIDPFEEMRLVELHERLVTGRRGTWQAAALMRAATLDGQRSLGFGDAGAIEVGRRADLVGLSFDSVRTAGVPRTVDGIVFAASGPDVSTVVVDGSQVRVQLDGRALGHVIDECWSRT